MIVEFSKQQGKYSILQTYKCLFLPDFKQAVVKKLPNIFKVFSLELMVAGYKIGGARGFPQLKVIGIAPEHTRQNGDRKQKNKKHQRQDYLTHYSTHHFAKFKPG